MKKRTIEFRKAQAREFLERGEMEILLDDGLYTIKTVGEDCFREVWYCGSRVTIINNCSRVDEVIVYVPYCKAALLEILFEGS